MACSCFFFHFGWSFYQHLLSAISSERCFFWPGDLRLRDNPALYWAAFKNAGPTVPIFVWCPEEDFDGRLQRPSMLCTVLGSNSLADVFFLEKYIYI